MTEPATEACDLLIEAGWVVPVQPHGVVLEDHAVAVSGGRIVAVLPTAQARERFAATEVVTCFGDSITAGWYVYAKDGNGCKPPCGGYEPALQQSLLAAGHDVVIRNYGVGGETTGEGLSRIDSVLTASNPKYVLLLEGTNDALLSSPGSIHANLSYMVDRILARNAIPILATLTPDNRNSGVKPIEEINSRIKTLAAELTPHPPAKTMPDPPRPPVR